MPRLRRLSIRSRLLAAVLIAIGAGCSISAPQPGTPHAMTSSAIAVYNLTESGRGKPGDINHGKPVDIDWHAASDSFFVATYNDGTIYPGAGADSEVPVYMQGTLGRTVGGITIAHDLLYVAGAISGQIRVYDLATKAQVGRFETGSGGDLIDLAVTGTGDVWATDGTRAALWHLTSQQVTAGNGTTTALPLTPRDRIQPVAP